MIKKKCVFSSARGQSYVSFLRRLWHLSLSHSTNRTCLWLNHNYGSHWSSLSLFDWACDQLFLKDVILKLFYAKDEEFVQICIYTVPSELPSWNCGKHEMENCIRSFSILFPFELSFCVYLTEENAVLGWEDFFLSDVNNIFIFVCRPRALTLFTVQCCAWLTVRVHTVFLSFLM